MFEFRVDGEKFGGDFVVFCDVVVKLVGCVICGDRFYFGCRVVIADEGGFERGERIYRCFVGLFVDVYVVG